MQEESTVEGKGNITEAESGVMTSLKIESGPLAREYNKWPLEAEKGMEVVFPFGSSWKNQPCQHLALAHWSDFSFLNFRILRE